MNTMQHITPLPRRVQPLPWEDFGSFLVRTAKHMDYETPHWILKPETSSDQINIWDLPVLSRQADYDFLSQLLLVPETHLYQMTIHRFSPLLEPVLDERASIQRRQHQRVNASYRSRSIDHQLFYRNPGGFFLSKSLNIRICPLCLTSTETYDHLYWRIKPLLTFPLHNVLLQGSCPICLKKWPIFRPSGIHCPSCFQPFHQHEKDHQTQNHPAFFSVLQGDALLLQRFGYEQGSRDRMDVSLAQDFRALLPPEEFFLLFRLCCTKIASLSREMLSTFLPPSFYEFLTLLKKNEDTTLRRNLPIQVAIAHWLFLGGETHFFAFLDTLNFLLREAHPHSLFRHFPCGTFASYTPTFRLLHQLHQRYRSLYEAQGIKALDARVLQRLQAFASSGSQGSKALEQSVLQRRGQLVG